MCFRKRNKPVRLEKKTSLRDKIKQYISIEILVVIFFIICFILAIKFAMGEQGYYYYNVHNLTV